MENITPQGFIYLIACEGVDRVKIGFSINPTSRMQSLATGAPGKLSLVNTWAGTQSDEALIHRRFSDLRTHLEWFEIESDEASRRITNILDRLPVVAEAHPLTFHCSILQDDLSRMRRFCQPSLALMFAARVVRAACGGVP
jgi:hypothetical protein